MKFAYKHVFTALADVLRSTNATLPLYTMLATKTHIARDLSQYEDHIAKYRDSHYKDVMVVRPSYLYNGNPCTGKMTSLYWDGPLITFHAVSRYNSLQWHRHGRNGVSNHQHHDCLFNRLFRRISKKTSKLRVTGLCVGNSPVTGEFPTQRASYAKKSFHLMTSSWNKAHTWSALTAKISQWSSKRIRRWIE